MENALHERFIPAALVPFATRGDAGPTTPSAVQWLEANWVIKLNALELMGTP